VEDPQGCLTADYDEQGAAEVHLQLITSFPGAIARFQHFKRLAAWKKINTNPPHIL
jgi:hypothetical protein